MTKNNRLTRPFVGPQFRSQIAVGGVLTHFSWNFNPENTEFEIVQVMSEGTDDAVEFSSPFKEDADSALEKLIERDYPGLLAQGGIR